MKTLYLLLLIPAISIAQSKPFKHEYKKFIDCRIDWNFNNSLSDKKKLDKYRPYVDKEIVILTTDEARQKFTMERGYLRVQEFNNKKTIIFQYNQPAKDTLAPPGTSIQFHCCGPAVFWTKYTYSYFADCYDKRGYK